MKLYMHPVSTTSRPITHFIAENNIPVEFQPVDILKGEHYAEEYSRRNPNRLIPMLEDGDFRLTESATILRYLADKIDSPAYPKDLRPRAKVNEMLDWFNSHFYRDWGYGLVYPQVFPNLKREDPKVQSAILASGQEKSREWLGVLDRHWLGAHKPYLCGEAITIADYFGLSLTTAGELIHCDFAAYPNIARWLRTMKRRPGYAKVYEVFNGFVEATRNQPFLAL